MKHTDKYYQNRIKKAMIQRGYPEPITFESWCTPRDRWVRVKSNYQLAFESYSFERLYDELRVLFREEL